MPEGAVKFIQELHRQFKSAETVDAVLKQTALKIASEFSCDFVAVHYQPDENEQELYQCWGEQPEAESQSPPSTLPVVIKDGSLYLGDHRIKQSIYVADVQVSRSHPLLIEHLERLDTKSFALIIFQTEEKVLGWAEVHFRSGFKRFRPEHIFRFDILSEYATLYILQLLLVAPNQVASGNFRQRQRANEPAEIVGAKSDELYRERLLEARQQYRRLLEYGNLIIVRTNAEGLVVEVVGDTDAIFGVKPIELVSDLGVWERFLPPADLRLLMRLVRSGVSTKADLKEELRVINQRTNEIKHLLIRGFPLFDSSGERLIGWEGFAVDITEKHQIQEALQAERKRLEALYEISQSLSVSMDPAILLLTGLKALIKATNADAGICLLLDENSNDLQIAASDGFPAEDLAELRNRIPEEALYRSVMNVKNGQIISGEVNLGAVFFDSTLRRGAIIVPLQSEAQVRGVVALFAKKITRFKSEDLDVADVAAKQICSVLRQSEFYTTERKTSDALAFLYRLSHVLSQFLTPKDIAENAFPIIQEEIPCKRMWLGILNDQGTIIAGQAGIGPGVRGAIARVQIELDLRHDFLDDALKKRQPVIIKAGESIECSGLNRILQKLQPATLALIPLVALGQVVGLLVLEPVVSTPTYAQRKIPLFTSLGNELGSLVLARRFESRIADAEKMRMASLFAAGVAHNFNNLLQAIMGQASLIELQVPPSSPLAKSAQVINESATKGASLVQQLKSFSSGSNLQRKNFSPDKFLKDSTSLYQSILGPDVALTVRFNGESKSVYGDEGQIQRAIGNIVVNAKEAISQQNRAEGTSAVSITGEIIRLHSGEVHPELAPGSYLAITVQDTGHGIDPDKLPRIFEPFYTTKSVDLSTGIGLSGSGLGLSSAYSIVKQHDGIITAQSDLGSGTTFSIYIPLGRRQSLVDASIETITENPADNRPVDLYFVGLDSLTTNTITGGLKGDPVASVALSDLDTIISQANGPEPRSIVYVFDAETLDSKLLGYIRMLRDKNSKAKFIISCIDSFRWSSMSSMIGDISDLEVIEKSLGVWSLQSTIKRMLGIKRTAPKIEAVRT